MQNSTNELIQQKIQEGLALRQIQNGWQKEASGKFFQLETTKYKDYSLKLVKIQGAINQKADKLRKYYFEDLQSQKKSRPYIDILQLIEKQDENNSIVYYKDKSSFLVSSRDSLYQQHQEQLSENLSIIISIDVDKHPKDPAVKGCVRAQNIISVQFFEKLSNDQTKIEIYFLIDPKGNIPASLVNSSLKESIDEFERDVPFFSQL